MSKGLYAGNHSLAVNFGGQLSIRAGKKSIVSASRMWLSAEKRTALPLGAEVLHRDLYVDIHILKDKSKEENVIIMDQTYKILSKRNFKL